MSFISTYLKIALMVACTLVGIQVPGFVDQYGKNLHARLLESNQAIAEFQNDANKYFGGDLNQLIKHYKQSGDDVVIDGGLSIESISNRNQTLREAMNQFDQSTLSAYAHTIITPVTEIREDVWNNYSFNVLLNKIAIITGVLIGLLCLFFFEGSLFLARKAFKRKEV